MRLDRIKGVEYEADFNPHIGSGGGDTAPLNGLGLCPACPYRYYSTYGVLAFMRGLGSS